MLRLKEDHETLVCRTTWERERRLTLEPDVFFLTDHPRSTLGFYFGYR